MVYWRLGPYKGVSGLINDGLQEVAGVLSTFRILFLFLQTMCFLELDVYVQVEG